MPVSDSDCSRWTKGRRARSPDFARLDSSSARATMQRRGGAFVASSGRVEAKQETGYPGSRGRERPDSIEFPACGDGIRPIGGELRLQHVGTIRVKPHRTVGGAIRAVALKREAGRWYVASSCELPDAPALATGKPHVGIDAGLEEFPTPSDGHEGPNPGYLEHASPELRRAGRAVSRKQRGGADRRKAVERLKQVHAGVEDLRREHHRETARRSVRRRGFVAFEGLNIRGMLGNDRPSRAIGDAGWSGFLPESRSVDGSGHLATGRSGCRPCSWRAGRAAACPTVSRSG